MSCKRLLLKIKHVETLLFKSRIIIHEQYLPILYKVRDIR